jgi:hypothetical protein
VSRAYDLLARRLSEMDPEEMFRSANGLDPLPWQRQYLREVLNSLILKGRQVGASTCGATLAVRQARYVPGSLAAIVSPSLKQSSEVKIRASSSQLERLGEVLRRDSATTIELGNGSRILSLPGSAKSVRGWTADLLIIDEAAFLDQDTFLAARATTATGGRTVVQSTPAGPFGHFYDLWETTDPTWAHYRVSSEEVGTIDPSFLARERATLSDDEYAQEYQAEFRVPGLGLVDPASLARIARDVDDSPWAAVGEPA